MTALEASLKEQVMEQLQVLDAQLERDHRLTLLRLWVEDLLDSDGDPGEAAVHLDEALSTGRLYVPERLSWCQRVGIDRFGVFADVEVDEASFKMRWIPAGSFLMGFSETEESLEEDEDPQHEVQLTAGYWLCEVPCTQALYQAVVNANPSEFKSLERPVESVSFNDCQTFLQKLNDRLPGLHAQLPTEAQWEYACRAGTTTSTYAGGLKILGENNGPMLDEIAWYGGNSGHEFDLEDGADSGSWPEKQYDHKRAGTRLVGLKEPNAFGLFDMLGNVEEWCADDMRDYEEGLIVDPMGSQEEGTDRVVRGGAWSNDARVVRAACRGCRYPEIRYNSLGFRFCRGQ